MINESGRSQFGLPVRMDHTAVLRSNTNAVNVTNPSEVITVFRGGMMIVSGLAGETLNIAGRIDHDGSPVNSAPILFQNMDGTLQQAVGIGNGTYYFDVLFERLVITKSGAVSTVDVAIYLRS
jgi:hypothetical protein